jgi:hypothetical protein
VEADFLELAKNFAKDFFWLKFDSAIAAVDRIMPNIFCWFD